MSSPLIAVPDDYQPWRGPEDGPHPLERARELLREAASVEDNPLMRDSRRVSPSSGS